MNTFSKNSKSFHWDGVSAAAFSYTFAPDFGFITFFDASAEPVLEFSDSDFDQGIAKSEGSATFFMSDALDIPTTFHFNETWPDPTEPAWANVVEGVLAVPSGKLFFGAGTTPEETAITLPKGVYIFRVYAAQVDSDADTQEVHFYFNATQDKESDKITVLKQGEL